VAHPIISALFKSHKSAAFLVALEFAVTCAVLCNAIFLVSESVARMNLETGVDSKHIVWVDIGDVDNARPAALKQADSRGDIAALARMPGVVSVAEIGTLPLSGAASTAKLSAGRDGNAVSVSGVCLYPATVDAARALNLKLVEGRDFAPSDAVDYSDQTPPRGAAIVTEALARRLWPQGDALGRVVYGGDGKYAAVVVGVVERLLKANVTDSASANDSILFAVDPGFEGAVFAIRSNSEDLDRLVTQVPGTLATVRADRIVVHNEPLGETISNYFRQDRQLVGTLVAASTLLVLIAAMTVGALASYWVQQRQVSIGIRRALGASRADIVVMFLGENLLVVGTGVLVGVLGALFLNRAIMSMYEVGVLSLPAVLIAALLLLILGQIATLIPVVRGSLMAPINAIRSL
jgi:putative ABC transport system permease protein